jgi:hypothetical protein
MTSQFRSKMAEMEDLQREINVRTRDSTRLQELRRTLERNRDSFNAVSVAKNEGNGPKKNGQ